MKKIFMLVISAFLFFGISLNAASKDNPVRDETGLAPRQLFHSSESQPTGFPNPGDDPDYQVYAYNAYDPTFTILEGPVTFVLNNPTGLTSLASTTSTNFIAGACWIAEEETWYGTQYGGGLYTIDPTTGNMTFIANTISLSGIEYDDATGIMYGTDGTSLFTVDWTTGATTLIGFHGIGDTMIGIAGDGVGNLYGVTVSFTDISPLYSINLSTGAATSLGSIGAQLLYAQDLAFDKDDGVLYSAAYFGDGTPPGLYSIDTTTCGMTLIGNFPGGMEVTGFAIPYTLAEPGAPAAPTNLEVTAGAAGALECDINWTCPSLTFAGNPLNELLEMRVYRNGVLVYTDFSPVIGGAGSYTDYPAQAGMYNYLVVGYNSEGEGCAAHEEVWVGEDVPDAVTDITLTVIGPNLLIIQLDWVNPTTGFHGGYFNGCTGYDIVRSDGATFNITGSTTTWQDYTIPAPGYYSYTLTPYNNSGYGPSTTVHPFSPPYIIQIGNSEISDYQIPINLWYMDSMVEVIYLQDWIGSDMLIETVSFHVNSLTTYGNGFNLEIWLGETTENDLSAGWINGNSMTQCFDGTINVTVGDYWVDIPLDTNFEYTHTGNLAMMIIRDDNVYYGSSDMWWCTESNVNYRTRYDYHDYSGQYFNAFTGPFNSDEEKSIYPDVRFYYSYLEHGNVSGVVTNSVTSDPIEGAEVYVGNWGPALTNTSGEYLIEEVVAGVQPVTATKEGFYNFSGEVTVIEYQNTVYDIAMEPNEFGGLDGMVTDYYTGEPLGGAEITAESAGGYFYETVTNADGLFSIVNIVAETYDVSCSFTNYPTQIQENVVVVENAVTSVDFMMEGYPYWNNFEDNDGGFISNNPDGWQWGIPVEGPSNAYSGVKLWGTVLDDNYPNGANLTLDTPVAYQIPNFMPTLSFWHWYDTEASYDGGNVKVSTDGVNWEIIEPLTGYTGTANTSNPLSGEPIFCGQHGFWENVEFDLASYAGENVKFRWHFGSDSSVQYPGWYIDDFSLTGYNYAIIYGTVIEFGTEIPIEGATVSVELTSFSDVTNESGEYEIVGIGAGIYNIICEASLYLSNEVFGFSINTMVNNLDFSMLWSEISVTPEEITITLPPDTTDEFEINITNNGPGDLEYSITVEYTDEGNIEPFTPNNTRINRKDLNNKKVCEVKKEFRSNVTHDAEYFTDDTWLGMITNASGVIPGNGGLVIAGVTINTADLIAGEIYTANLVIQNNSNYGGDFILPVTLIIEVVNAEHHLLPLETKLIGNYPNPFNPTTTISFSLTAKDAQDAKLEIYNLKGQKVKVFTFPNGSLGTSEQNLPITQSPNQQIVWDGTDENNKPISSGIYFYKLRSKNFSSTRKMILMK